MIVDIGGGTTEVAVISLAGIVFSQVGPRRRRQDGRGDRPVHQAQVQPAGRRADRRAHQDARSAPPTRATRSRRWRSRAATWSPASRRPSRSSDEEIREALAEPINQIVEAVRIALERTPPELAADIVDKGIVLAGGGALLRNLDVLLREETGLPVMVADDPLTRGRAGRRQGARRAGAAERHCRAVTRRVGGGASCSSSFDATGCWRRRRSSSLVAAALIVRTSASRLRDDRLGRRLPRADGAAPARRDARQPHLADVWRRCGRPVARARGGRRAARAGARPRARHGAPRRDRARERAPARRCSTSGTTLHGDLLTARVIGRDASGLSRTHHHRPGRPRPASRRAPRCSRPAASSDRSSWRARTPRACCW